MTDSYEQTRNNARELGICAIIPTYNNAATVASVVSEVAQYLPHVIVVNDGSTDETEQSLSQCGVTFDLISHKHNRGKGYALRTGFQRAIEKGFTYAITLDSDKQHFPSDIPQFVSTIAQQPGSLIVGNRNLESENMPKKNTFANKFSNFWFYVQTGMRIPDTQTGFRLYPLRRLQGLRLLTSRYEAELELLVFSAWAGVRILSLPIHVYYPPQEERVSHFRPAYDFTRISILNTILCIVALIYGWPRTLLRRLKNKLR